MEPSTHAHDKGINRRKKLSKAALLGTALLATLLLGLPVGGTPRVAASGATEALLLSCMDYRLVNETEAYMSGRGLKDKYDHVILAGASLGATTDKFPHWGATFWDHLDVVAIKLHNIHKVIVLDHRDCGAYKLILGADAVKDAATERATHAKVLKEFAGKVSAKYPDLDVELLLIGLDGKVEPIEGGVKGKAADHH
jgi:hypothetical protein